MYFLKLSRICLSRLYNNKFKTKIGFFSPSKSFKETETDYSRLTIQNRIIIDGNISRSDVINYGIFIQNDGLKLDLLHQSINHIFNKWPDYRVCLYANSYNANRILKSSKIIQRFPTNKVYQTQFKRVFRKGGQIMLLSDNIFAKIPKIDMVIHYDLPVNIETFIKRLVANKANLFFYGKNDKLFISQLQNYLNFLIHDWPLPSNQTIIDNFLNQLETIFKNKNNYSDHLNNDTGQDTLEKKEFENDSTEDGNSIMKSLSVDSSRKEGTSSESSYTNLSVKSIEFDTLYNSDRFDNKSVLASLLYMIHHKFKGLKKRQYLLYDPKFKVFKSRELVIKYLNDNGVVYSSVNLCKNGFVIESLNDISLSGSTPIIKYKKFKSHIIKVKKLIRKSYLSSPINKRKYFKKLIKEHERKIINKLKSVNI